MSYLLVVKMHTYLAHQWKEETQFCKLAILEDWESLHIGTFNFQIILWTTIFIYESYEIKNHSIAFGNCWSNALNFK